MRWSNANQMAQCIQNSSLQLRIGKVYVIEMIAFIFPSPILLASWRVTDGILLTAPPTKFKPFQDTKTSLIFIT